MSNSDVMWAFIVPMLSSQIRTLHPQRSPELILSPGFAPQANSSQILSEHDSVRPLGPSTLRFPNYWFLKNGIKNVRYIRLVKGLFSDNAKNIIPVNGEDDTVLNKRQ